ncbi:hypothetical protein QBC43DRAFT_88966 [Cladorrhinum sp. PSN259]|nr:hypothetical protein QBC43DRAFT_88966 [Cladorrhinum sp. PSN259]
MANNSVAAPLTTFTSKFKITSSSAPKKAQPMPSLAPAQSQPATAASANAPALSQAAGFGVLTTTDSNVTDASNPHRDGRIRNPVPSKLKGKTDGSKGNFSVMHMDVAGRTEATERDAEAKRTSESTELAAKRAFENGYIAHRRSRFVQVPEDNAPMVIPKNFVPAARPARTSTPTTSAPLQPTRLTPLSPEETKSEQARLLTLLRSLHPVLVVDQICKALAFFGGIPGALPPADGVFPPSAESNGSGSLFVGWIAEIFPKLGGNGVPGQESAITPTQQPRSAPPPAASAAAAAAVPTIGQRKRGRPRGSKGTKPRVDKGIKKGPLNKNGLAPGQQRQPSGDNGGGGDAGDESWVDVDDDAMEPSDDVDANVLLLAQANTPQPQYEGVLQPSRPSLQPVSTPARTALPGISPGPPSSVDLTASAKKRGRPKGSKNRPRDSAADSLNSQVPQQQPQAFSQPPPSQPAQMSQISQDSPSLLQRQSFTAVNSVPTSSPASAKKVKKAAGNKQRPQGQSTQITLGPVSRTGATSLNSINVASAQPAATLATASQNGQTNVQQTSKVLPIAQAQVLTLPTPPTASPSLSNPATTGGGQRRKRKAGKESAPLQGLATNGPSITSASPQVNGLTLPTPPGNTGPMSVPATTATATSTTSNIPPAKRQRKNKNAKPSGHQSNNTTDGTLSQVSAPPTIQNSSSEAGAASTLNVLQRPEQPQVSPSLASEATMPSMSSLHSPQQTHFEVQSPTMENYEAQLQAQLEQQTELESQPVTHYSRFDSTQSMASRHQQQQQQRHQQAQFQPIQQQQQPSQQTQQQHQQPQKQQKQQHASSHSKSPSIQSTKSQSSTPLLNAQQQTRNSYSQYQYTQPPQTQQSYSSSQTPQTSSSSSSSSQQQQSQFVGQQQHGQGSQASSAQQYPTNVAQSQSQPQQYSSTQQSYGSTQQQYSNGQQQQQAPQQRFQQQLTTSSASTTPYPTHQSPQFGTATSNSYNATTDGTYRSPITSLGASSYNQRSQSGTPSTAAPPFRANSGHSLSHHSPSYSTATNTVQPQQRSSSTSHNTTQSMQGISGTMQTFTGSTGADWMFDPGHLDTSGQQAAMGLGNTSYGLGTTSVRTPNNAGSAFNTGLANFDASSLGGNDRYYNVGRR